MNVGKIFEEQFRKSVPDYCFLHRLKDSAESYNNSSDTKFAWDNPCDFFLFDTSKRLLYALELKSTKYKSMAYQESKDSPKKMIKYNQIVGLNKINNYDNTVCGFILNFRDEEKDIERTYFLDIDNFNSMINDINKKSFDEIDIIKNGAIKIEGRKLRKKYIWDIESLLKKYE